MSLENALVKKECQRESHCVKSVRISTDTFLAVSVKKELQKTTEKKEKMS